ncbi:MAG: MGH1-like glycoside hydrolase domain-containing protein [Spirochaetaceae bacterium]
MNGMKEINQTHSREHNLPQWGPYSRHYGGAAWIAGGHGQSLLEIIPVIARERGGAIIPDVNVESGYHHWDADPALQFFSYRYELAWKDLEYADVTFHQATGGLIAEITFVNNSEYDRSYVCTAFAHLRCTPHAVVEEKDRDGRPPRYWIGAEGYETLSLPSQSPLSHPPDGLRSGLTNAPGFVDSIGLGNTLADGMRSKRIFGSSNRTFLMNEGAEVGFSVPDACGSSDQLVLRYSMAGLEALVVEVQAGVHTTRMTLKPESPHDESPQVCLLPLKGPIASRSIQLRVMSVKPVSADQPRGFALDGLCLSSGETAASLTDMFTVYPGENRFDATRDPTRKGVIFTSREHPELRCALYSELERPVPPFPYDDTTLTHVYHHELDGVEVRRKLSNDALTNWSRDNCTIRGSLRGHFAGYNLGPVVCRAGAHRTVVLKIAATTDPDEDVGDLLHRCEGIEHLPSNRPDVSGDWVNSSFTFSQDRMKAQLFTTIVYPCRIGNEYVRAYTPGKRFGSIFTWDSGMHGIGMTQYEPQLAYELVHQYLPYTDDEADAVVHGPPQPIHMYLLHELLIRTGDTEFIASNYPRIKRYFEYFAGLSERSRYSGSSTGILNPHHDSYGSAGIDDYPAKHFVETHLGPDSYAPVITSAHAIRCARLMGMFASLTGNERDIPAYNRTRDRLTELLQRYSWDETSGYFSFTSVEDGQKLYYDEAKTVNFNMGLDGVSPLFAGVCTDEQANRIVSALLSDQRMWSPAGITSVDRSAPYYRPDGYWVGKVWMPHQWMLFKGMLDHGFADEAETVAMTALKTWQSATDGTYNCYELFDAETGMGGGCHQFAGLSGPIASFYSSFFRKGAVTVGFDSYVRDVTYDSKQPLLRFSCVAHAPAKDLLVLVVPGESGMYEMTAGGERQIIEVKTHYAWLRVSPAVGGTSVQIGRIGDI